jgi:hypothetical protein
MIHPYEYQGATYLRQIFFVTFYNLSWIIFVLNKLPWISISRKIINDHVVNFLRYFPIYYEVQKESLSSEYNFILSANPFVFAESWSHPNHDLH